MTEQGFKKKSANMAEMKRMSDPESSSFVKLQTLFQKPAWKES